MVGQLFWSLASCAFGLSRTYGQVVAARVAVGVGEASLSPSAYSFINDSFQPQLLARALSVYGMGIFLGLGLANLVGGAAIIRRPGEVSIASPRSWRRTDHFGGIRIPPSTRMTSAFMYGLVRTSMTMKASSSADPSRLGKITDRPSFALNASACSPSP